MAEIREVNEGLKEKLIEAIRAGKFRVFHDPKWEYPNDDTPGYKEVSARFQGQSEKTLPLLHLLFRIEQTGGYVLKIEDSDLLKLRRQ